MEASVVGEKKQPIGRKSMVGGLVAAALLVALGAVMTASSRRPVRVRTGRPPWSRLFRQAEVVGRAVDVFRFEDGTVLLRVDDGSGALPVFLRAGVPAPKPHARVRARGTLCFGINGRAALRAAEAVDLAERQ